MSKSKKTTIKVSKEVVARIEKIKIHPRQSNEEIIEQLLEEHER